MQSWQDRGSIGAMNWIEITHQNAGRHELPESGIFTIGRGPDCSLRILEPGVSRSHASIQQRAGTDWIRDLASSNGTWLTAEGLPSKKITDETSLRSGDRIRIGSVEMIYHQALPETLADGRWSEVIKIGSGGMGEVFRALDRDLGCLVAVKKIRSEKGDRSGLLQRLHAREAAIGRGIDHPNVVRVLDDGIVDGSSVQVMEWVGGGDLSRSIMKTSRDPSNGLEMIRQIALGLVAAHESGVVHADLKPGNILLVRQQPASQQRSIIIEGEQHEPVDLEQESKLIDQYHRQVQEQLVDPPFVSRSGELALIEESLLSGDRCWIPIFGERGVGRSRLAREVVTRFGDRHQDRIHLGPEFTLPPDDFDGIWLTSMPQDWPDESTWIEKLKRAKREGWSREIYLRPLLPGPAARWVEMLVDASSGEGALFLSNLEGSEGADGHPARLLGSIVESIQRGAWTLHEDGARLHPLRMRESARAEAKRLGPILETISPLLRQALERIALFAGNLTGIQVASLVRGDAAIFHSLVAEAIDLGLLAKDSCGRLNLVNEGLGQALADQVADQEREPLIAAAATLIQDLPPPPGEQPVQWLKRGRLLRIAGRLQGSIEAHLQAALIARSQYMRSIFIEALDEARAVIREAAAAGERRAIDVAEKNILGGEPRGLVAIERLRRLPIDVGVKIADFGIARFSGESTHGEALAWGTPRYMSPEQARKETLTPASDLFSLGLLAREVLEGKHPLGPLRGAEAIRRLARADLDPMSPTIERALWADLIGQMLSLSAADRPSALAVAQEIAALQARY
ncbi:MAG: protein kinase [Planctomycetota bacterium]|nr:protein kinase [Planctomycetota bacterium]